MNTQRIDLDPRGRPKQFSIPIQGGMLEALGINMYTSLGKSLVEFAANAYDAEASEFLITIPFETIAEERKKARIAAKTKLLKDKSKPRLGVLLAALPECVEVRLKDNGHGMSPDQVADKFLPLNRHRRTDASGNETDLKSESGSRFVMGRKGLGKLAGFGVAELVTVKTKRKDDDYLTVFKMDYRELGKASNLTAAPIAASYETAPIGEQGTEITLSRLKCDSVKNSDKTVSSTLLQAFFGIEPTEFSIQMNTTVLEPPEVKYGFSWPLKAELNASGLADASFDVEDIGRFEFEYIVNFRKPGESLPASKRGARVYCNGRLAAGPSLFGMPTGMHNFHAQDYMECVVRADELDRDAIDFVNTNRTQLKEDNEVVRAFLDKILLLMTEAIKEHSKNRDAVALDEIKKDPKANRVLKTIELLPAKMRSPGKQLLKYFASAYGTGSKEFEELAPFVVTAMNSGEILIRLIDLGTNPKDLQSVISGFHELSEMEMIDALKVYRGRRSAISGLQLLFERSVDEWRGKQYEKDLHSLLKEHPWLVDPTMGRFLTSDIQLKSVASELADALSVDDYAPRTEGEIAETDDTRPDLVFVAADSEQPYQIVVIELKSPNIPLEIKHQQQLKTYLFTVRDWLQKHYPSRKIEVKGILIGTMPDTKTASMQQRQLIEEKTKASAADEISILGLREMLEKARLVHADQIDALERHLEEEDS